MVSTKTYLITIYLYCIYSYCWHRHNYCILSVVKFYEFNMKKIPVIIFVLITVISVGGYASRLNTGGNASPEAKLLYSDVSPNSITGANAIQSKEPVSKTLVILMSGFLIISLLASIRRNKKARGIKNSGTRLQKFNSQIKHTP